MNKFKSRNTTVFLVLFTALLCTSLFGFIFLQSFQKVSAEQTPSIFVQKVVLPDAYSTDSDYSPTEVRHILSTATNIANGQFVMLNTEANTYDDDLGQTQVGREAVYISFGGVSLIQNIELRFNGKVISHNYYDADSEDLPVYTQYLHALTPTQVTENDPMLNDDYITRYDTDSNTAVETPEGRYDIAIQYYDQTVGKQFTWTYTIYITTQTTYSTLFERITFNDTEKFTLKNQENSMLHYFNFTNYFTTIYDENGYEIKRATANKDQLYYPQMFYNPEKYEISYTRTLYNYVENVQLTFTAKMDGAVEYGELIVSTTTNTGLSNTRSYRIQKGVENYTICLQFDNAGEYVINKTARLRTGMINNVADYELAEGEVITSNQDLLKSERLVINGYTARYADTRTTTDALYDNTYAYNAMKNPTTTPSVIYAHDFLTQNTEQVNISVNSPTPVDTVYTADFSFLNETSVINQDGITLNDVIYNEYGVSLSNEELYNKLFNTSSSSNLFNLNSTLVKKASTNLAPVLFEFYGKLIATSASWYAYQDSLGNITVQNYTRNLQFQNAGTYIVYLTYENLVYETGQTEINGKNPQYHHQLFYFEITNTTPQIEVYATDSPDNIVIQDGTATVLNMDDYTNKYVYCSWQAPGPFDAQITAKYLVYDWNSNLLKEETLNGLIYQKGLAETFDVSPTKPTILYGSNVTLNNVAGLDGTYHIQIFRNDSPNAFVNHTFQIDTSPITGITALEVVGKSLLPDSNNNATVISKLSEDENEFNLATNKSFAWTWNDKQSGAKIYAKYIYSSLQTISDFKIDLDSYIAQMTAMAENGAVLMKTNGEFGGFTPPVDYYKVNPTNFNTSLASSQIISSPQLAILLLADEAGNTEIFATILDTTKTQILQKPQQTAFVNIITEDTTFYWGTHKSLSIADVASVSGSISDIFDFVNNDYTWTLSNQTYTASQTIKNAFNAMNISQTKSIVFQLDRVEIYSDTRDDANIVPYIDSENKAHNWYAVVKVNAPSVDEPNKPYTTQIYPDGKEPDANSHPLHELTNEQFSYTFLVSDIIGNYNERFTVEVNLDRSRGALYSYNSFEDSFGTDLTSSRTESNTTNRQLVSNSFSTNRRYITFSWTEPAEYFKISSIVLNYYPFSYNKENKNYPYADVGTTTVLYSLTENYSALYTVNSPDGAIYYQTKVLLPIDYVQAFNNGTASSEGMYVITRTYNDNFEEGSAEAGGDVKVKEYVYYLDRNAIIPSSTSDYGSDIILKLGYDKGEYEGYPDYGGNYFNQFSRTTNTDTFNGSIKLGLNTSDPSLPSNIVIDTNILPASIYMSTWKESVLNSGEGAIPDPNSASIYDKYYTAPSNDLTIGEATQYLNSIFDKYRNSSRLQVVVQFFRHTTGTSYAYTSQTFYSNVYKNSTDTDACQSLDKLQYAFKGVGRYRIMLFDLANFQGVLTGNASYDFASFTYSSSLSPNCTIFNFEITGVPPAFNFQSGDNSFTNIDTTYNNITNDKNVRISWTDPTDDYSAQIAFNSVLVTKTIYTKNNPKIDADGNEGIGLSKSSHIYQNPILLTYDEEEYNKLLATDGEIENVTFIYRPTLQDFDELLNASMTTNVLSETKFYKIKINDVYNYFILMPRAEYENQSLYGDKLVDVEYTATVQYIAKDNNDYIVNGDTSYFQTTQTVYVDNTAPYQNLVNLIENDIYLQSLNSEGNNFTQYLIDNIDNPDVTFLKSYAFAVPKNFILSYLNEYETGLNYYFFKRENYNGNPNQQTVIESQTGSSSGAANIFDPTNPNYKIARYKVNDSTEGLTYINEVGYYDIIEQDKAGNMRVYTVYVTDSINEINASIGDQHYIFNTNINDGTVVYNNNNVYYTKDAKKVFNSEAFRVETISNADTWLRFTFKDLMNQTEKTYYLAPENTLSNVSMFKGTLLTSLADIVTELNAFIEKTAQENFDKYGSQIQVTIDDRIDSSNNINFYINTPGLELVPNADAFLQLITINADNTFTIKLPSTTLSTKIVAFRVYLNGALQSTDSKLTPLPTKESDFDAPSIANGFIFNLSSGSNIIYKFEFVDNFGRTTSFSYPIDSSIVKYLEYSGATTEQTYDGKLYTYTSSETKFVYDSNALRIQLSITDLDTNTVLYTNVAGDIIQDLDTNSQYFGYEFDDWTQSITTLTFRAPININYLINISVDNYTDTATNYSFIIYTHFPRIALTDTAGSPLLNQVTSKSVLISWVDVDALFSPYVTLVSPNGVETVITSPTTVEAEGVYTVNLYNSLGKFVSGSQTFTIRSYAVAIYGVNQINSDNTTTPLTPHSVDYSCTILGVNYTMPHYFFLSSDRVWSRTIEIICNEDKGLSYRQIAEFGNTRVYNVYGTTTHIISTYFAVTRIPSDNISSSTDFRINGETMTTELKNIYTKETDTETAKATLTWKTTYEDNSVVESDTYDYIYADFYNLELWYNGVKVGVYTNGSITLTQSGIYKIRIYDAVGQNQYFGSGYNEFTLTIINDVVFYVNNLAPIQYATYSQPVDIYIPLTFSGDLSEYDSMAVTITRNNVEYSLAPTNGHYIFTEPGVYNVSMRGSIKSIVGTNSADLLANYQFTLLSSTEALASYEFASMTGYEVIQIVRSGTDITDLVRGDNAKIYTFYVDPDNFGVGRYEVTVRYAGSGYNPSQDYTFNFWINNEEPIINTSRSWGSSGTGSFTITINPASIYERVGDCFLVVNNTQVLAINAENGSNIEPLIFTYSDPNVYVIQLQSASGNILTSNRITITVPLNTAAIILIVVAVVVVIGLIITFVLMRTRMKVR